ncbi:DegT/DnrJ/EryC1/StrS family aminotransferase, partial [Planctomycetota bacterium]
MSSPVPFALPDIGEEEIARVVETLRSGWITTGPRAKAFEAAFAAHVGAQHAVAVNSCTAALHLALEAVGVSAGDEVIVPTLTFAATGEVVRYLGATTVLVDVLPGDHQMDPAAFERAVTERTRAVIPVHFAGQPADLDAIGEIAAANDIFVIEDAAHALPASFRGRTIGSVGHITCFSFYASKPITTGEGGMSTTDNSEWADRMRVMSLHGISRDAWQRYSAEGSWYYEIVAPGFKYNMPDIAAAMGLVQLQRAEQLRDRRRAIADAYTSAFKGNDALELLEVHGDCSHAWHLFVIKLKEGVLSIDRNRFIDELRSVGIGVSVHFIPLHLHPYYRRTYGYGPQDFPIALDCYQRSISLPLFSA